MEEYTGIFHGSRSGYGFVEVEGFEKDIFVASQETGGAMDQDTVVVRIVKKSGDGKSFEGRICRITKHAHETLTGTWFKHKKYGFVVPDHAKISKDIYVELQNSMHAKNESKVVVSMISYEQPGKKPEGKIIEILGSLTDPNVDAVSVLKSYGIAERFPDEVLRQTKKIPNEVREKDLKGRRDLRQVPTVTIDGEDARDLDDAVSISKEEGIYHLGVHIADVSQYIFEGSPLDLEARARGNSVYLTDRVIPMLPQKLSNGICSLNEGCDRLTLSCLMDIDETGTILDHEICESVIRSDHRMTYTAVNAIITDHDPSVMQRYPDFVPIFEMMKTVSQLLRTKRKQRGGIDFDFPESKILLDETGFPIDIRPYKLNAATMLIEDFMLAANETIAEDSYWQDLPFLYRTHETPDREKIDRLCGMLDTFGYKLKVGREKLHPKEFQKLLGKISGTPQEMLISRLVLRSMKQARYTAVNNGHFGLAMQYYCHFTSPIRRYPDLMIHRIIKENLHGKLSEERIAHYRGILPAIAADCSRLERRAEEAEREEANLKKIEYMSQHIGETFVGIISGFQNFGMYVELENTCEGVLRFRDMEDDYYKYCEDLSMAVGEMSGRCLRLGDRIRIIVSGADKLEKEITFLPAPEGRDSYGKKESERQTADRE